MVDLYKLADQVTDEKSFLDFISFLAADRADEVAIEKINPSAPYGPGANGWENGTVESFLTAAVAWAESSINGLEFYKKPDNPWKRCAQILLAGKFYE